MKAPGAAIDFETDTVHRKRLDTTIPLHQTAAGQYEAADPHILGASAERRGREGASPVPGFSVGPGRGPQAGGAATELLPPLRIAPLAAKSGLGGGLGLDEETGWGVNRNSGATWGISSRTSRASRTCTRHVGSCQSCSSVTPRGDG